MRLALVLCAIDPLIGGVLIRGERGTAKSTMARAVARLLPKGVMRTLALNTTADALVGSIDLEQTLAEGKLHFDPGLLVEADQGFVYVDEVNLLDDHLGDLLLDAAASGIVRTERDGFSLTQPARFSLVATMNPEEGHLRPQLLDRFGLCVDVVAEHDLHARIEILERALALEANPMASAAQWQTAEEALSARLIAAREALASIQIDGQIIAAIVERTVQAQVAGHRADLAMTRAARAHAAWHGRTEVLLDDVDAVAELVLRHRRRATTAPEPPAPPAPPPPAVDETETETSKPTEDLDGSGLPDVIAEIGEAFAVRDLGDRHDRQVRKGSGRRQCAPTTATRGRQVNARPTTVAVDLALTATIRASAVHQRSRRARAIANQDPRANLAVIIERPDWMRKVRVSPIGSCVVLVIDASGSMGANNRMVASKGAVLSLLLDAYVKRDTVALVSFRRAGAEVLVPPTSSIELAERRLRQLPVGGRTPLAAGLMLGRQVVDGVLRRQPTTRPMIIVVTDGRGNVDLSGRPSRAATSEAHEVARRLAADGRCRWVVVDTDARGHRSRGDGAALATALDAQLFSINNLKAQDLVTVVDESRNATQMATGRQQR